MTNSKPIIKYSRVHFFFGIGEVAAFILEDGETLALTSEVVDYSEETEIIETENSVYVPA